jgi:hypothetical protein
MDRGNFFHSVYRIEQKLGRGFRELEPYALFPLDEYFNGPSRSISGATVIPAGKPIPQLPPHLEFPVPLARTA